MEERREGREDGRNDGRKEGWEEEKMEGWKEKERKPKHLQYKKGPFQPSRCVPVECSLQEKGTVPEKVAVLYSYPSQDVGNNPIC